MVHISQFRDFINSSPYNDFCLNRLLDVDGKDKWSCLCSAMDWLTEAEEALLDYDRKRWHKDMSAWICLYSYISCIAVIVESIEQIYRCIFNVSKVPPLARDCFSTRPLAFSKLADRDFFKELRAAFGAHPVNLKEHDNERRKRYACWVLTSGRGQTTRDFDYSVNLYSGEKGVSSITLGVKESELEKFRNQYQGWLEKFIVEIKRQYAEFTDGCKRNAIKKSRDSLEQWNILVKETQDRWQAEMEPGVQMDQLFSMRPTTRKNRGLITKYRKAIRDLMKSWLQALTTMDDQDRKTVLADFYNIFSPSRARCPNGISYEIGKFLSQDPMPVSWKMLGSTTQQFLARYGDFRFMPSDAERMILVNAVLYHLTNARIGTR